MNSKHVAVIGAGTMGNGIAQVFAMSGYTVNLYDIRTEALDRAVKTIQQNMDRMIKKDAALSPLADLVNEAITTTTDLERALAHADFCIEAASENMQVKLDIFAKADKLLPSHAILATNTSSISITTLAAATARPDKVIGMHFMNPVPVMKLVEIIKGYSTSDETTGITVKATENLNKIPVIVEDYPGFVANRILMPMINEAVYTLYEGVAGVAEIDTVMKLGMAHPMGPLTLADFIGLDVCLSIMQILYDGFGNPKYAPCPLLVNMVKAGKLGRKTGEGLYTYNNESKESIVSMRFKD
jgi:3-hydroxybutyryl-CoA dehydrogenase